jgi:uncharacterized protein
MSPRFTEVITSEAELRELMGYPNTRAANKAVTRLDQHLRGFIAKSPFMLIASSDKQGNLDISPKGDPAGFVQVLDDTTLAIPDRPGNRRADTLCNLLENPQIALYFMIPAMQETLRVSGTAQIVRDRSLREQLAHQGKVPELAIVVTMQEGFFHCPKCMVRSHLWQPEQWPDIEGVPTLAQALVDHSNLQQSVAEVQASIDQAVREQLY